MASLLSPRRTDSPRLPRWARGSRSSRRVRDDIALRATTPAEPEHRRSEPSTAGPRIGWPPAALAGALLCLVSGWLLVAGLAVLGWVAGEPGTLAGALAVGTRLWAASHGVAVPLGGVTVTLVPWGATALLAFVLSRCAGFSARSARADQPARPLRIALLLTAAYLLPVLVVGAAFGSPARAPGHVLAVAVALGAAAWWGAHRALHQEPVTRSWPVWLAPVPRAVLGSQLVLLGAGLAALLTALVLHWDRVLALHAALAPGITGTIALVAAQLALLPNACVWAASYALGGGFTLGNGSVVAPAATQLGVLPGLPLLGALPAAGPGPQAALGWLASGVLAGAVAAWLVVRARPRARVDETALVGGLSGVLGGLAFVVVGWAARGDLGSLRLAGLGPLLLPLLVMAATTLGLAGMVTGLVLGLRLAVLRRSAEHPPDALAGNDAGPDQARRSGAGTVTGGMALGPSRRTTRRSGATAILPTWDLPTGEEPSRHLPVTSGPVESGPVESGPVESGPVESGPVESGPGADRSAEDGSVERGTEPTEVLPSTRSGPREQSG